MPRVLVLIGLLAIAGLTADRAMAQTPCDCGHAEGCPNHAAGCGHYVASVGYFNCNCSGSYKFPVPPLYTYHWAGMYSQQTMTEYVSPYRFPSLILPQYDPQPGDEPTLKSAQRLPAVRLQNVSQAEPSLLEAVQAERSASQPQRERFSRAIKDYYQVK